MKIKSFSVTLLNVIINWHGEGCYKISASDATIIVDPHFSNGVGGRLKGDIVIKTTVSLPLDISTIEESVIIMAGEYDALGVKIKGTQVFSDDANLKTIYKAVVDGISFGFLGNIDFELNEKALDDLGQIDILFVPSNNMSGKLIKLISPNIAIPGWGDPAIVITETGQKPEPIEKLVIKKKDIEANEGFRLIVLQS